ncbi:unnamed protein product [marine sediment metagenome]|uniref:Uncharacterized protein n=1 Tax=marine sediment metagenome TaxID=412755 RepID=X0VA06_9ZZZZ
MTKRLTDKQKDRATIEAMRTEIDRLREGNKRLFARGQEEQEENGRLREENAYLKDPLRHCCDLQDKLRKENERAEKVIVGQLKTYARLRDRVNKLEVENKLLLFELMPKEGEEPKR